MLCWATSFVAVALVAGLFALTGIAAAASDVAGLIAAVFLVLSVTAVAAHAGRLWGRRQR